MTGNVVFVGFALAQAPGFSLAASLIALVGLLVRAGVGGAASRRLHNNRGVLLRNGVAAELILVAVAAALATALGTASNDAARDSIVAFVAVGFGIQNAISRRLAVPDITTNQVPEEGRLVIILMDRTIPVGAPTITVACSC